MKKYLIVLSIVVVVISGCREINSTNPNKCYEYWTGQGPNKEIRIIHAKYWQSAHFSKEYIAYFELNTSSLWKQEFIKQNHLIVLNEPVTIEPDAPYWFRFSKYSKLWKQQNGGSSIYVEDTNTGHLFIYENQL